jgi:hypothetical protein
MKLKSLLLFVLLSFSGYVLAEGATSTMASVLVNLNHFPSPADKAALAKIVEDPASSADEKALAQIISRIAHQASSADKLALEAMLAGDSEPAVKTIAKAILATNHKPTADDIAALKSLEN